MQQAIDATPEGGTICFGAGVYSQGELHPSADGQVFDGMPGTVLDGGGNVGRAIANYLGVSNITIEGFEVRNYASTYGPEDGVLGVWHGSGWTIQDNHVHDNAASAINVYEMTEATIRHNLLDHNGCGGVNVVASIGTIVSANEIAFNGLGPYNQFWSCGGGKSNQTVGTRFVGNYTHDNTWGWWLDNGNTSYTIRHNRIEDNLLDGVYLEANVASRGGPGFTDAGFGIRVIGNYLSGNGLSYRKRRLMHGAAIELSSNHVEIARNSITASNAHGITITFTDRGQVGCRCKARVFDVSVRDNDIGLRADGSGSTLSFGRVGFYSADNPPPYVPANVLFGDNRYYFADGAAPHFALPTSDQAGGPAKLASWTEWRAAGNDLTSTVEPATAFPASPPTGAVGPALEPTPIAASFTSFGGGGVVGAVGAPRRSLT